MTSLYDKDQEIRIELRKHIIDMLAFKDQEKNQENTKLTEYILKIEGNIENWPTYT